MAEILPIRAWRYHDRLLGKMEELTAPLFDVVSSKQRELLYENPFNSIHLSVPNGPNPAEQARKTLEKWKQEQIIVQDEEPGIYVYYQYFRLPGEHDARCRKGFIAHIKAYDWDENLILRHENTIVHAVNDRIDLLKATEIQASPTHGLYEDPENQLESFMDEAMENPIYELEDYQGVKEVLGVIRNPQIIAKFLTVLRNKQVILADGHHRLEGAIQYRKSMQQTASLSTWNGFDYHMMYLTNTNGNHLKILPTHRIFKGLELSNHEFVQALEEWFEVKKFHDQEELGTYSFAKKWSYGLILEEECYLLQLKPEKFDKIESNYPDIIKKLDLAVLHGLVFDKILGIPLEEQRFSENISYERNFSRCIHEVQSGKASFAVITRELELSQVLEVCRSGYVMPQKSTYFYPKALGGLLFASINQQEFEFDYGAFFK
ncbi:DUF1015 domain-containing protein [Algoriphagus lutimaris]|uniref:DUF1015 domain-containing protein n=1 Tax=Algoriphagus lutimaris TaxID=613197 RepID=UPI00196A6847|nr:DUF1015 domain-containing protein [Algoriphagus lutimaris]MBN3519452.1 DUF1015 domain-containing protein [Algoriphagus lutimaris]